MSEGEKTPFKDLSDDEKKARIQDMRDSAKNFREKYKDGKYYSFGEAIDDIKQANGAGETTVASVKLVGKSLFNIGRFTFAEVLPAIADRSADLHEQSMKKK